MDRYLKRTVRPASEGELSKKDVKPVKTSKQTTLESLPVSYSSKNNRRHLSKNNREYFLALKKIKF